MSEKQKELIEGINKNLQHLDDKDLLIVESGVRILKIRQDMEKQEAAAVGK